MFVLEVLWLSVGCSGFIFVVCFCGCFVFCCCCLYLFCLLYSRFDFCFVGVFLGWFEEGEVSGVLRGRVVILLLLGVYV